MPKPRCTIRLHRRGRLPNATHIVELPSGHAYACTMCMLVLSEDARRDNTRLVYRPIPKPTQPTNE